MAAQKYYQSISMTRFSILFIISVASLALASDGIERSSYPSDEQIDRFYGASSNERGATAQRQSLVAWRQKIVQSKTLGNEERISMLGECVVKMTKENIYQVKERFEVYDTAKETLLSIPGHAEYYRDQVLAAQAAHRDDLTSIRAGEKHNDYITEQSLLLETLSQLPSVETVKVLGEFLSDEWVQPGAIDLPIEDRIGPMSLVAVRALSQLPLVNKPSKTESDSRAERDLRIWQLWYEQIKAGNRTFRFEGDPTEYDLNGPAPKEKLQRVERDLKRDEERSAGYKRMSTVSDSEPSDIQSRNPLSVAGLIAACLLSAFALWLFVKRSQPSR